MDFQESVVQTYEKVLSGEQKSFSPYFFQPQHRREKIAFLLRHLVERVLGFTPQEALEKLTIDMVKEKQLAIVLKYVDKPVEFLDDDVRHLVYFAYPDMEKPSDEELVVMVYRDVLDGNRKTFPKNYFLNGAIGEKRAVVCFKYLCENLLGLDKEGIVSTFSSSNGLKVLAQYKLKIIMNILFCSMIDLLETAYPKEFDYKAFK